MLTVKCTGTPEHDIPMGTQYCPQCGKPAKPLDTTQLAMLLVANQPGAGIPASTAVIAPQPGATPALDVSAVIIALSRDDKFQALVVKELTHQLTREPAMIALIEKMADARAAAAVKPLQEQLDTEKKAREAMQKMLDETVKNLGEIGESLANMAEETPSKADNPLIKLGKRVKKWADTGK